MSNLHGKDPARYKVAGLCRLFGVSKQAYYKTRGRGPRALSAETAVSILEFARAERTLDPGMGCRKLWRMYTAENPWVSRAEFGLLMGSCGMMLRRRQTRVRTTVSSHGLPLYPDLVHSTVPDHPCQIWVADITYVRLHNADGSVRFAFLSVVMDSFSRYIQGYCLGRSLETVYTSAALLMALDEAARMHLDITGLIHHSDRGVQYASADYVKILRDNGIAISMTQDGNPKDNPQSERVNSTIKNELLKGVRLTSIDEGWGVLGERIRYYNERRPHMSLGGMTPAQALRCTGPLKKEWHSFRDDAIAREKNTDGMKL